MRQVREQGPEVLRCLDEVVRVSGAEARALAARAGAQARRRFRVCAHRHDADGLHEMIIALARGVYVPPHRHLGRPESFHVVEGRATVLLFDEAGTVKEAFAVGEPASDLPFYCRIDGPVFHALIVETDHLVFHETTTGPFDPRTTEQAPWAPRADDAAAGLAFLRAARARP